MTVESIPAPEKMSIATPIQFSVRPDPVLMSSLFLILWFNLWIPAEFGLGDRYIFLGPEVLPVAHRAHLWVNPP